MNGAVHENVVSVNVSPISSVASVWLPPCFRVSESSLLTSDGGRPKSNTPNRLSANAMKMPVMRRFTQGLDAEAVEAGGTHQKRHRHPEHGERDDDAEDVGGRLRDRAGRGSLPTAW